MFLMIYIFISFGFYLQFVVVSGAGAVAEGGHAHQILLNDAQVDGAPETVRLLNKEI